MKRISVFFWSLAAFLSDIMCAVASWNYLYCETEAFEIKVEETIRWTPFGTN